MTTLRSGSATDVGNVRSSNQDVALEEPELLAVADGMGGHVGGEVAARVAVGALRGAFHREPTVEGLRRAVAEANRAVWSQGQSESELRGMGTTLTATALVEEPGGRQVIALANVGDSRAYVFWKGQIIQVTADHSLAEEKVRQGQLTEAEAAVHPHRHILTRALGVSSDVDVDLWELHLHDGDRILLCSDGLTNEIGDELIGQILGSVTDPSEAARALVKAALDHGGNDNVTCIVIDVVGAEPPVAHAGTSADERTSSARGGWSTDRCATVSPPTAVVTAPGRRENDGTSNEVIGGAPSRALRALDDADLVPGHPAPKSNRPRNGAGPSPLKVVRTQPSGVGAGTDQGASPESGTGSSSNRLQAAELRRLRPTRADRRHRRRTLRAQRLVTVRLVLFALLVLGVLAATYFALRWYANDDWYVGIDHGHLAIYQGRRGGFLWFKPQLVDETPVTTHEVLGYRVPELRADQEPSLAAAETYVRNLHAEYLTVKGSSTSRVPPKHPSSASNRARTSSKNSSRSSALPVPLGAWQ